MSAFPLLLIALCMAGEAFFAGMETGVISIHRMRLRHFVKQGDPRALILQQFLDDPDRLLGTTLVGTNLCVVMTSVLVAAAAETVFGPWGKTASTACVGLVLLTFCEYLPKVWFYSRPLDRSRRCAGLLQAAALVFRPIASTMVWLTRWLVPGPSVLFGKPAPFVTRDDLKMLAREGEREGVLSSTERVMIHRVFELSGKRARQIMTPRSKMIVANHDMTAAEFLDIARNSQFTRIPVFDREKREFVGIVNVFFVLSLDQPDPAGPIASFMRPPLFVPAGMPVDDILPRLRRSRQPMALVRDDASEVIGLVTTEDILEEIVGRL